MIISFTHITQNCSLASIVANLSLNWWRAWSISLILSLNAFISNCNFCRNSFFGDQWGYTYLIFESESWLRRLTRTEDKTCKQVIFQFRVSDCWNWLLYVRRVAEFLCISIIWNDLLNLFCSLLLICDSLPYTSSPTW